MRFLHISGEKILLAAGGPVEPFWDIYTIHKTPEVKDILDSMLIGRNDQSEAEGSVQQNAMKPYANEPKRHPGMVVNSLTPFDAESPPEILTNNFKTPNDVFYIRNHLPVPQIDPKEYKLKIVLPGNQEASLTLDKLKNDFKKTTIVATLQCAGNRRTDMGLHKKIYGASGGHTSISNAEWGGVLLRDVLLEMGLDEKTLKSNTSTWKVSTRTFLENITAFLFQSKLR